MDPAAIASGPLEDVVDPAPVEASEVVFDGRVWDVRRDTVAFGGGTFVREYVAHTGAVGVLAISEDDQVLLINQYRHPIGERDWELPAGLLDMEGEDPLAAAQRELAEEADVVARDWTPLVSFHPSPGGSDEIIHIYCARGLTAAPNAHDRTDEEAEIVVRWVPRAEVLAAALEGRLRNGPLLVAVLAAHARGI